jgi:recombination protein RecR
VENRDAISYLVEQLSKLPGVGQKTAERFTFHFLRTSKEEVEKLIAALRGIKEKVKPCQICFNLTEGPICQICQSKERNTSVICVVETPRDLRAIEHSQSYRGLYHVLMGAISPLEGITAEDLKIEPLLRRVKQNQISEIIIATNPNSQGEFTANYLCRLLKPLSVKITRIARGVPVGGDIEYADKATLSRALQGRIEI